jgi:hypothetical protein
MNNLYEALENCLQAIEQGADVETVLLRYPDLADELRPILEASAAAKSMAAPAPSAQAVRRNRAKVLQQAAQMREEKVRSSQRIWFVSLRRIAVTLAVVTVLFVSGTGLVGASSNTLPGDNLYPVKRTWEGIRLLLTFSPGQRDGLEIEHENERLQEVQELLTEGRSEEVDFSGLVTSQNGNEWVVAGVRVRISSQTEIRDPGIAVGSPVRVRGLTQGNGIVLAERIRMLSSDAKLPDAGDEHESETEDHSGPGSGTGDDQPRVEETETPGSEDSNSNSGSDSDSNSNENQNDHGSEDVNSDDNSGNSNEDNTNNDNESNSNYSNDNSGEDDSGSGGGGSD